MKMASMSRSSALAVTCLLLCSAAAVVHAIGTDAVTTRRGLRQVVPADLPRSYPPAKTTEAQKKVLLDSKEYLAGNEDGLTLLESWNEDNDLCTDFRGISCKDGLIEMMTLIQVADSTMEDEYGDTYYVPYTDPDPDGPKLTGQLPASWASLTSLTNIYLSYNVELTGPLPASWSALVKMDGMDLANQKFTGPLPASWSAMKKLGFIDISGNKFTGQLPSSWSALTNLQRFNVRGCGLKGPIPPSYAKFTMLLDFKLSGNEFSGVVPKWLSNNKNLLELDIAFNKFSGALPAEVFTKTRVAFVGIHNNPNLSGCIPKAMQEDRVIEQDGFNMQVFSMDDLNNPENRPVTEYPIKKGEPTLQGTKVTGLCPK